MIVPMRKTTLILLPEDRLSAVAALRDLGVMHIESAELAENADRLSLENRLAGIGRAVSALESAPGRAKPSAAPASAARGETVCGEVTQLLADVVRLQRELERDTAQAAELAPWGDFDGKLLDTLRQHGLHVQLCAGSAAELAGLQAEFTCVEFGAAGKNRRFAVISAEPVDPARLPLARINTEIPLRELAGRIQTGREALAAAQRKLAALAAELPSLIQFRDAVAATLEFATVRDTVGDHGRLLTLTGFVPEPEFPKLEAAARTRGWGLAFRDADVTREAVPTLIKRPRWARIIEPLMNFLSISPGYDERDVSVPVLIFFTIFFGMLVGDAGYGTLFLAIFGMLLWRKRGDAAARVPLVLMCVLSGAAILWGGLSGNWFGTEWGGLPALTDATVKDRNVQLICFSLALLQLALARALQLSGCRTWRPAVTQIGWIFILIGNFLLVCKLLLFARTMPAWATGCCLASYAIGLVLTMIGEIDWTDIGSVFGFPFSVVSSFVDVLSYIRLFAVGLAGYYLAACFNDMARPMLDSALTMPVGLLILLLGHLLNIALAAMSVLVHGVRLNTLEFSSHLGLRWAGFAFAPFRKRIEQNEDLSIATQGVEK